MTRSKKSTFMSWTFLSVLVVVLFLNAYPILAQEGLGTENGEWRYWGADERSSRYSPLDQINAGNVSDLEIVWRQSTIPDVPRQGNSLRPPAASQNTQLIARRIRELGVYCEIQPYCIDVDNIRDIAPLGIILSGGPETVSHSAAPRADPALYELQLPLLGAGASYDSASSSLCAMPQMAAAA